MSDEPSEHEQWAMIFNEFGEETLRGMLLKAAERKRNNDGRIVIEFDQDRALDITDHHDALENQ